MKFIITYRISDITVSLRTCLVLMFLPLVLLTGSGYSQDGSSVSIKAMATVIDHAAIEMVTLSDLVIDEAEAVDGVVYISARSNPQAGNMLVKGRPDAQVRVSYMSEVLLKNLSGAGSLKMQYEVFGFPADNQQASERIDNAERPMRFNGQGQFYLWLGGRVDMNQAQPGQYTGEFTIEFEYI